MESLLRAELTNKKEAIREKLFQKALDKAI